MPAARRSLVGGGWTGPRAAHELLNTFLQNPQLRSGGRVPIVSSSGEDWSCVTCTYINVPSMGHCSMCQNPRTPPVAAALEASPLLLRSPQNDPNMSNASA